MDTQLDPAAGPATRPAKAPPCAMVIFGASGDLTKRLLMPALYNLARAGRLSDKFALIGVDRSEKSHDDFREELAEGVRRENLGFPRRAHDPCRWQCAPARALQSTCRGAQGDRD